MRVIYLHYWHPDTHQTSTNRSAAFVKALQEAGMDVQLFTHKNAFRIYENSARNRFRDLLTGNLNFWPLRMLYLLFITVFKRRERIAAADMISAEGSNLASLQIQKEDILISSIPPTELAGLAYDLAMQSGCRWILDYRDPWTYGYKFPPYHYWTYQPRRWYYRTLEKRYLERADLVLTVYDTLKAYYPQEYQHKIKVIENGSNVSEEIRATIQEYPKNFDIVYAGTIFQAQLKEEGFFDAFLLFLQKHQIQPSQCRLHFIGSATNPALQKLIDRKGLKDHCSVTAPIPTAEALAIMAEARLFLHLRYGKIQGLISSKLYDYLAMQKRILLPISDESSIADSLYRYHAGYICHNEQEIIAALETEWTLHQEGVSALSPRSHEELKSIDRYFQAQQLVTLIQAL